MWVSSTNVQFYINHAPLPVAITTSCILNLNLNSTIQPIIIRILHDHNLTIWGYQLQLDQACDRHIYTSIGLLTCTSNCRRKPLASATATDLRIYDRKDEIISPIISHASAIEYACAIISVHYYSLWVCTSHHVSVDLGCLD